MREVAVVSAVRTAVGKGKRGSLKDTRLPAHTLPDSSSSLCALPFDTLSTSSRKSTTSPRNGVADMA